jgi:acyl dehydratase
MSVSLSLIYEQIKRELNKPRRIPVGTLQRREFQRFAVASDDHNPLFFDDTVARACGYPAVVAPPLYLSSVMGWEAGPPQEALRLDGTPAADATALAIEGLRLMGAGQELEFHRPATDGTAVVMEFSVSSVELKQGRSGALLVIEVQKKYLDGAGLPLVTCRENFIAR